MPKINNIEFLTLPEQVQKNKEDIEVLQSKDLDLQLDIDVLYQRTEDIQEKVSDCETDIITINSKLQDTGWQSLTLLGGVVGNVKFRKVGSVCTITGNITTYPNGVYHFATVPSVGSPTLQTQYGIANESISPYTTMRPLELRTTGYIFMVYTTAPTGGIRFTLTYMV